MVRGSRDLFWHNEGKWDRKRAGTGVAKVSLANISVGLFILVSHSFIYDLCVKIMPLYMPQV